MTNIDEGRMAQQSLHADFSVLRGRITGSVITPENEAYDDARKVHDIHFDQRPAAVVRAANTEDVVQTVRFAHERGVGLAVRSGGHGLPGRLNHEDAIVVDLGSLNAIAIDREARTARVQAGVTSGDLAGPAHARGLALTTGDTSSVGLGGLTTGGGIGWMVRKYGLTIDNLLSAEVVTADGSVVTVNSEEKADLFWAIRGGGGNFGVVTEFEFQLAPVSQVLGGVLPLPATPEVIRNYIDRASAAPDDLTTITNIMHAPPAPFVPASHIGELVLMIQAVWTGDVEDGERVLAPLRALAQPVADTIAPIPYPVMYEYTAMAAAPSAACVRGMFSDALSDAAIDSILDAMGRVTSPISQVQLRPLGGAMARVDGHETAFGHRGASLLASITAIWLNASDDPVAHETWVRELWEDIRSEAKGVYVNLLEAEGENRLREAYTPDTFARLVELKRRYDPTNMFRFNQNINPS
jgi:FAD/FMN-containing dehydrogenase